MFLQITIGTLRNCDKKVEKKNKTKKKTTNQVRPESGPGVNALQTKFLLGTARVISPVFGKREEKR